MALGLFHAEGEVTSQGVVMTLRCGNPDCNQATAQVHSLGATLLRVLDCPRCHRASEYENTTRGWTVKLLPPIKQQVKPR